ncbi:hypothetical protein Taro_044294 [Colocasia esculenta]|uniref:Uncharacterized protein n=1 Tax=Colocasia esculenta TaxID=4460 RepID=A0A843WXY6_COLES|nr:hypothetical protein [Colocasia esculenta]
MGCHGESPDEGSRLVRRRVPMSRPERDTAMCRVKDQEATVCGIPCEASARSRETDSGQAHYCFNWLGRGVPSQLVSEQVVMADRRDWGGGGDDPEESTQRMIERIWESLTEIRMRMDQQAPVPPVTGEAVPVAPVPPSPEVETPTVVTSPVGCPRFFVSQAVSLGLCSGTCVVPSRFVSSDLDTLTP